MEHIKRSQLALSNFPYTKFSLDYTLNSLERMGGPYVEFYAAYPHFYLGDANPARIDVLAKKFKQHGLQVIDFCPENCTYPLNAASADPVVRARTLEQYVVAIQAAHALECPNCLFFPAIPLKDEDFDEVWKRGVEAFRYLADYAETYGVTLILEQAKITSSILYTNEKVLQFKEEVGSPNVSGMIDTTNCVGIGCTLDEAIDQLGIENIKHVHFKNAKGTPESFIAAPPGDGFLDLASFVKRLDTLGYDGYFGVEMFKPYYYDPDGAMQQALDWFDALDPVMDY